MPGSTADLWREAFVEHERTRTQHLLAEHQLEIEDALKKAGLTVLELLPPVEAGLEQARGGIAAKVQGGDAEPALLQVRLIASGENVDQRFAVYATGPCRRCGVIAPLEPSVELPQQPINPTDVSATFGEALTYGDAAHSCGREGSDAGVAAPGMYL